MGHEDWLNQKSEYATAAVTPGAADSYGKSFKDVANHRLKILKKSQRAKRQCRATRVTFQDRAGCQCGSEFDEHVCCRQ